MREIIALAAVAVLFVVFGMLQRGRASVPRCGACQDNACSCRPHIEETE